MRSIKFLGALVLAVFIAGFATTVFALACTPICTCTQTCDTTTGTCGAGNASAGTACDADNNLCTQNDVCDGSGTCVAGTLKVCTTTNTCKNQGACIPSTGLCPTATNKSVGTPCDDGNACTLNDACAAGGICKGTTNFCRDTDSCTQDACTAGTGVCTHTSVGTPGVCGLACPNPIPAETKLLITAGQGSATNVPCSAGSCFSMVNGTDIIWTDILPGTDGGFWVGHAQASGGQELPGGGAVSTSGALTAAWNFFQAEGTFFTAPTPSFPTADGGLLNKFCGTTCSGYDCINKTELKVFTVAWNGGPILMGSLAGCVLSNCSILNNNDVMVNDWQINPVDGGAWSMDYAQVVPVGSFSNVNFKAILRGTVANKCIDAATRCNDNNVCTDDTCDSATGNCLHANVNDGTPCTSDGLVCTTDTCLITNGTSTCTHTPIVCPPPGGTCAEPTGCPCPPVNCNNNNACDVAVWNTSTCVCDHTLKDCNDSDICTVDTCDPATGCVHTATVPPQCNDNNACTTDGCTANACTNTTITCNDNNPCTTDTCNTATGCVFTPKNCNDNDACTTDSCDTTTGNCVHTTVTCATGTCDPVDACHLCSDAVTRCDDGNPCTTDTCVADTGACVHTNNTESCNAGNACTSGDFCSNGVCHAGTTVAASCLPTTPKLAYPVDGQTGLGTTVDFRWIQSTDPNNASITYKIYYCSTPGAADCTPVTVAHRSSTGMFYAGGAGLFMIGMTFFSGLKGRKRNVLLLLLIFVLCIGGTVISCSRNDGPESWPPNYSVHTAQGLNAGTTYYWKVVADNGIGTKSSTVQSFTTM